ncbi:hypothetical protein ACHAXR_009822 [Thalassiosira sp. AJA248-18]
MLSAAQDGEDAISDGDGKIEGRKKRVIVGYKAMMITYLTVGLLSVVKAGVTPFLLCMIAGQVAMPAGISYIMISAAKHDRLSSDTYKRLNLALLEFGLIGVSISAIGGRKQDALLTLSFVLTVINSIKGYTYGVLGWDKQTETTLPKDLLKAGTKDTVKGFITVPKNFKSFTYMAATAMVASLKLLKLNEIVKFVQANSITAGLAPLLHRFNRLAFFTLMLYTVKDAADRDRLGGTTFIQLNYLCALSMGASLYFDTGGIATPIGALSAVFSAFFAFTGITSYMKNQYA